jgi:hypothetical protein
MRVKKEKQTANLNDDLKDYICDPSSITSLLDSDTLSYHGSMSDDYGEEYDSNLD